MLKNFPIPIKYINLLFIFLCFSCSWFIEERPLLMEDVFQDSSIKVKTSVLRNKDQSKATTIAMEFEFANGYPKEEMVELNNVICTIRLASEESESSNYSNMELNTETIYTDTLFADKIGSKPVYKFETCSMAKGNYIMSYEVNLFAVKPVTTLGKDTVFMKYSLNEPFARGELSIEL